MAQAICQNCGAFNAGTDDETIDWAETHKRARGHRVKVGC